MSLRIPALEVLNSTKMTAAAYRAAAADVQKSFFGTGGSVWITMFPASIALPVIQFTETEWNAITPSSQDILSAQSGGVIVMQD